MYKSEVIGKNGISARVVAKSVTPEGVEIVTWEYEAPKCILAELNTHCMLAKNAQSSRAVPIGKVIEQIRNNPVIPVHWGVNRGGMVAGEEINNGVNFLNHLINNDEIGLNIEGLDSVPRDVAWKATADIVAQIMQAWQTAGYHKQIVNRIGEAFTMVKGVITATEFDNFFHLRYHPHADPFIKELAKCMWEAYEEAPAKVLDYGEWHTPYYGRGYWVESSIATYLDTPVDEECISLAEALKISSAACGQVSYRKLDLSEATVNRVWDNLMGGDIVHASVTEHQATPIVEQSWAEDWPEGVTHIDREGNLWSAKFKGWICHRKLIPNEVFKGKFKPPVE